jgi:mono/diheme cytochrome c family protein
MPAYGGAYSDSEIAAVANYVTARFGAQHSAITPCDAYMRVRLKLRLYFRN